MSHGSSGLFSGLPAEFGRYTIEKLLGKGGMGAVYLARDSQLSRHVALKVPFFDAKEDPGRMDRFVREARSAARLHHPNICTVFDVGEHQGRPFITMAFIQGKPLEDLFDSDRLLPVATAVEIVRKTAVALQEAHQLSIVHRDLKPANIMVTPAGEPVIMDFGLAKVVGEVDAGEARLTQEGALLGTPKYMAPEQVNGQQSLIGPATDVYALGVILFELLTGRTPYSGPLLELLSQISTGSVPNVCDHRRGIDETLNNICRKAMSKRPTDRYSTMCELEDALGQVMSQKGNLPMEVQETLAANANGTSSSRVRRNRRTPSLSQGEETSAGLRINVNTTPGNRPGTLRDAKALRDPKSSSRPDHRKPSLKKTRRAASGTGIWLSCFFFGILIVGGVVLRLRTVDGTLVVSVNESDAEVQVLNEEGKVEITRAGQSDPITISVDPGKHRLKVTKSGFTVFGQDFEIAEGGRQMITAKLNPLTEESVSKATLSEKLPDAMTEEPPAPNTNQLAFERPDFHQWVMSVRELTVEQQVKAVSEKLVELNPGFDGKVEPRIENGEVEELHFSLEKITDLSPVRALPNLKVLIRQSWFGPPSNLSDLSPLKGMSLSTFNGSFCRVSDLTPLAGMKLSILEIVGCPVSDLSPLKGAPLLSINCNGTQVSDLTPLREMPLKVISAMGTRIVDLSPLEGLELAAMSIGDTNVADLSALKAMPIETLYATNIKANDYTPIVTLPLKHLGIDIRTANHVEVLRSIKTLETINGKPAADFWK